MLASIRTSGQSTYPVNGIRDDRHTTIALTNVRIVADTATVIEKGTLILRNGLIEAVGAETPIPNGATVIDLTGRTIYPSFVEPWSDYGMPEIKSQEGERGPQLETQTAGAYSWNQALRPETDASKLFRSSNEKAESLRKAGFGAAMSLYRDGIARGTAVVVSLGNEKENLLILNEKSGASYSFNKGTSRQEYPTSEMGAIALLRQTWLDAEWYAAGGKKNEFNISLEAWNSHKDLPKFFESNNRMQSLRAHAIAKEFGFNFIFKGSGDEYKRIDAIKATGSAFLIPLNFPEGWDVTDPFDALNISLEELRHWENAPSNALQLHEAGVKFAFTGSGMKDAGSFMNMIRKTVKYGLPKNAALAACTQTPADLIGIGSKTGSLKKGKIANFIVTSGDLFNDETIILENWVAGKPYMIRDSHAKNITGEYELSITGSKKLKLAVSGPTWQPKAFVTEDTTQIAAEISWENTSLLLKFTLPGKPARGKYSLSGYVSSTGLEGTGFDSSSKIVTWKAVKTSSHVSADKHAHPAAAPVSVVSFSKSWYPDKAYGFDTLPVKETILIKNVTVWTNEDSGILKETDVLIRDGKIAGLGKNLSTEGAKVIDGTGKHLTAGIIDEHSHIAVNGDVNECSHAVTAEVRIGDVINPDDINIYRQLAGGVTTSQLLHGSCNPIGGQSAIIKLRWGRDAEQMKFAGADGFIKFALGENVKQSNWGDKQVIRYPQSRMGVEQVYIDAFTRAVAYDSEWKKYGKGGKGKIKPRRDLQLETLAEIINNKRFISCHSYQQGEINMLMHVADTFGFRINTFTHILEGYKVADKMKAHGAGASSFSDWWAYKYEVIEAIPHNGPILHDMGVVTAYNSDDAEMARRLNQEAAKAVKYGGLSEEEALKFVTLNPAKLLHIDNRVGSIKTGKDADVVLWSDNPLSIYAKAVQTYVDGILYFDAERDLQLRRVIEDERARLIAKMIAEKKKGGAENSQKPSFLIHELQHCVEDEH